MSEKNSPDSVFKEVISNSSHKVGETLRRMLLTLLYFWHLIYQVISLGKLLSRWWNVMENNDDVIEIVNFSKVRKKFLKCP